MAAGTSGKQTQVLTIASVVIPERPMKTTSPGSYVSEVCKQDNSLWQSDAVIFYSLPCLLWPELDLTSPTIPPHCTGVSQSCSAFSFRLGTVEAQKGQRSETWNLFLIPSRLLCFYPRQSSHLVVNWSSASSRLLSTGVANCWTSCSWNREVVCSHPN